VIFPSDILPEASLMLWIMTGPLWLAHPFGYWCYLAGAFASGVAAGVLWWVWRGARGSSRGVDAHQPRGDTTGGG